MVAGVFHILNHAVFKASLFMAAGIIDHETGSRDMRRLNGLWRYMPWTGALAMIAAGAMAGVPLLNGFLSKEMFFAESVAKQSTTLMQWLLPAGATLAAIFSVAYSLRFIHDVFFNGEPVGLTRTPHEPPRFMRVPVEILVVLCLVVGLMPALSIGPLLAVGAKAALFGGFEGTMPSYTLAIWHGLNLPLGMSSLALAGGVTLYFALQRYANLHVLVRAPATPKTGGRDLFALTLERGKTLAQRLTDELQNDSLQRYLRLLVVVAVAAGLLSFMGEGAQTAAAAPQGPAVSFAFGLVWLIGTMATLATVFLHRQRLLALLLLGAVGLVVSLAFVYFSAPDLALTQLLVEVATIILMMLALHWLPAESPLVKRGSRWLRGRDAVIALAAGGGVAALTWAVLARPFDPISPYFLATTKALGGGTNTVNVILVDYRAFDTLGEITVLAVAGLIIHALLSGWRPVDVAALPPAPNDSHPLMLALITSHAATAGGHGVGIPVPARPQPARGRVHRWARAGDRPGDAVRRQRSALRLRSHRHQLPALGRRGSVDRGRDRNRQLALRRSLPDQQLRLPAVAAGGGSAAGQCEPVRPGRVPHRGGCDDDGAGVDVAVDDGRHRGAQAMMAGMIAIALGTLTACGVYLMLRARTFDLILGLTLLSYAVNLFIFFMGRFKVDAAPIVDGQRAATLANYADPLPQALVLTAIVIGFAMTAVMLVIALRTRAYTGSDHVDGVEPAADEARP